MKRLPINQDERMFLKSIENNAMLLLLMFKIYPAPINADSLAFDMKWDARKAKRQLDDLSSDGFTALMKGQGYVLTAIARRQVMEFFGNLIALPFEAQALAQGSQVQAQQALEANAGSSLVESVIKNFSQNPSTHSARALVVEDSLTASFKTDSSTTPLEAQNVRENFPTTEAILAASPILFGMPGVVRGQLDIETIDPLVALAVMAHCYSMRKTAKNPKGLFAPAGLAYKMLSEGREPRAEFLDEPLGYLPDDYLQKIGMQAEEKIELEVISESESEITPAIVTQSIKPDALAVTAWDSVKEQLSFEMNRPSFDNWVASSQALQFDGHELTVGVCNAYTRDWLESRLESTVNRLLIGILNKENVSVKFVVAEIDVQEDEDE